MDKAIFLVILFCTVLVFPLATAQNATINVTVENGTNMTDNCTVSTTLSKANETDCNLSMNATKRNSTNATSEIISNETNNSVFSAIYLTLTIRMSENRLYYQFHVNQTTTQTTSDSCLLTYWIESQNQTVIRDPYTTTSLREKQYTLPEPLFTNKTESSINGTVLFIGANFSCPNAEGNLSNVTKHFPVCIDSVNKTFDAISCNLTQTKSDTKTNQSVSTDTASNQTNTSTQSGEHAVRETNSETLKDRTVAEVKNDQEINKQNDTATDTTEETIVSEKKTAPSTLSLADLVLDEMNEEVSFESIIYKNTTAKDTVYYEVTAAGLHLSDIYKEKLYTKEKTYHFSHSIKLDHNQLFCSRIRKGTISSDIPLVLEVYGLGFDQEFVLYPDSTLWQSLCNLTVDEKTKKPMENATQDSVNEKNQPIQQQTSSSVQKKTTEQRTTPIAAQEHEQQQESSDMMQRKTDEQQIYQTNEHKLYEYLGYIVGVVSILLVGTILFM